MRIALAIVMAGLAIGSAIQIAPHAAAEGDRCSGSGASGAQSLLVGMTCSVGATPDGATDGGGTSAAAQFVEYLWANVCQRFDAARSQTGGADCAAARQCADPAERVWDLWGQRPGGTWTPLYSQCFGRPPTAAQAPRPAVTPALVLNELRRIGLPSLEVQTQPRNKTLVNFDTIFYARPSTFTRTITLLGQQVTVEARPSRFTWNHGDGTTQTTVTAGAPYPSKDVTHRYARAHRTVQARVTVTYTARFRVAGGPWQAIGETVSITGPATALRVSEATPVLSGSYD